MNRIRDWSDAPPELIGLIAERLDCIEDCVSFRGVCRSWRSVSLGLPHSDVSSKTLPWMMFPRHSHNEDDDGTDIHNFFSLSTCKYYRLNLPEATNRVVSGSPYGWIVLSHLPHMEIFNPLTRVRKSLPLLSTLEGYTNSDCSYYYNKVVLAISCSSLSTTLAKDRIIVLSIFLGKGKVAFTRPGDEVWTSVDIPIIVYDDILVFNNQVYVIDREGLVRQFDIASSSPVGVEFALPPSTDDIGVDGDDERTFYLVEMVGDLYMIVKFECYDDYSGDEDDPPFENFSTYYFKVFKLCLATRKWDEVFTLGDYSLFVGSTTSFSLLVSEYPELRSSICFTDHSFGVKRCTGDIGIFNLETRSLMSLESGDDIANLYRTPFWFVPNL